MTKMFIKAIVVVVVASIVVPLVRMMWGMGYGLHFHTHHPGTCTVIKRHGRGSEDFQILSSGLTFITSGAVIGIVPDLDSKTSGTAREAGTILLFDMNSPTTEAKAVTIKHDTIFNPDTFRPHGLSVLEDKVSDEHLLYVINHVKGQADRVEKFRYSPKTKELLHLKSIFSDLFRFTNDLVVIDNDNFYITNWMYYHLSNALSIVETIYRLPLGSVVFYNGTGATTVKDGLFGANGIAFSKDNRYLYVAFSFLKHVNVYERESDYDFRLVQEVKVHTMVDNLHLSESGDGLFGGCHPIQHKLASHFGDPSKFKTPSQILRLPLKDGLIVEEDITEEFLDQGDLISGSTVAGVYKNRMLIGSMVDSMVLCELPI